MFFSSRKSLAERAFASISATGTKAKPDRSSPLFSFRLSSGDLGVAFTAFRGLRVGTLEPLAAIASHVSNDRGEAIVFWRHAGESPPESILLEVRKAGDEGWTALGEVGIHPAQKVERKLPGGLILQISSDHFTRAASVERSKEAPSKRKVRRFSVALVGSHEQFEVLLDPLRHHTCMKVRKLFVTDKAAKEYRGIQSLPVADLKPQALADIDALVDFSDHDAVAGLHKARIAGEADRLPLLFVGGRRFFLGKGELAPSFRAWLDDILTGEKRNAVE